MKKFLALIIALVMALSLVACGEQKQPETPDVPDDGGEQTATIKVGFITLHDENSTYDLNFINAAKEAIANLGLTGTTTSSRPTLRKVRSATTPLPSWPTPAATSSLPTALVMSPT